MNTIRTKLKAQCTHMYLCLYICVPKIYVYMYAFIFVCICIFLAYIHIYIWMHVYECVYMNTWIAVYMWEYV